MTSNIDVEKLTASTIRALRRLKTLKLPENCLQLQYAGALAGFEYYLVSNPEHNIIRTSYYSMVAGSLAAVYLQNLNSDYADLAKIVYSIGSELFENFDKIVNHVKDRLDEYYALASKKYISHKKYKFVWMISVLFSMIIGDNLTPLWDDDKLASLLAVFGGSIAAALAVMQGLYEYTNKLLRSKRNEENRS